MATFKLVTGVKVRPLLRRLMMSVCNWESISDVNGIKSTLCSLNRGLIYEKYRLLKPLLHLFMCVQGWFGRISIPEYQWIKLPFLSPNTTSWVKHFGGSKDEKTSLYQDAPEGSSALREKTISHFSSKRCPQVLNS